MTVKEITMVWVVVKDLKAAVKFYTEVVGLQLQELHEQYGWAEFSGANGGTRLGLAQKNEQESVEPGDNAVVTFSVANLDQAKADFIKKGGRALGDVVEVPGHVRLQTIADQDGNRFQLVEIFQ